MHGTFFALCLCFHILKIFIKLPFYTQGRNIEHASKIRKLSCDTIVEEFRLTLLEKLRLEFPNESVLYEPFGNFGVSGLQCIQFKQI